MPIWHAVFAGSLVASTASGIFNGDLVGERLVIALVGVALLVAGYLAVFVLGRLWVEPTWTSWVYLAAVGVVWAVMLRQSGQFFWLQPVVFTQAFFLLPIRQAIVAIVWLVAIITQRQLEQAGGRIEDHLGDIGSIVVTTVFFVILGAWIGQIIEQSAERGELIERLEATRRELAEREREAAVHEERERLSRELHDTVAQDLVSIVTHLQAADAAPDPTVAGRHRAEAARMAHDGIAETRRLVWALRSPALEHATLVETLQGAVERWRAGTSTRATLTVTGTPRPLHPDVEVTLLRTAQEALANAARHAAAREVTLTLSYVGDVVTLDVHDDGVGFDPLHPAADDGRGLGLVGMRERAERLGGSLAVESAPGEGTTLGVTLPALAPA